MKPTLFLLYATALLCYTKLNAQISRTDSLTQMIEQSTELSQKAGWLLQRSQFWPGTEVERPMADARQALAYYQQTGNEKGQAEAYLQTALVYTRQNNYQVAIELDSQALQIANKINDKRNAAKALNYLGRNYAAIGKPDQAEQSCLQALQLQQDLGLERDMADVHNSLGIIYRKKSDIDKSLDQFDKGIAVAKKFNLALLLGNLYMNKANSLNEAARYDEAIGMHMESIHVKEKIKDERGLMQSYNNIALVFKQVREYAKSLEYLRKANRLAQQFNNRSTLGFSYVNMATLLIQMRQKDSVPWMFEQALAVFKQMGEKPGQALVYHNYGNYLMEEEKQYDRSEEMLKQALEIRRETKAKYDIASTMNLLGSLLTRKGKLKEAEDYLLQSLDLLRDENSYRKRDAYSYLADYYKAAGDFEDAYKYQAAYLAMRDTLVSEQEIVTILKRQQRYELEKKEAALALEKKDGQLRAALLSKKNQQLTYLTGVLLLSVLLTAIIYVNYRSRKKHAATLQKKNEQIETLIRELHHRVKNNLQVVSGLLSLQSNRLDDETARQAMQEGRNRVDAMAMIHQKLYMDTELASIDMQEYLKNLCIHLAGSFGFQQEAVRTEVQLPAGSMNIDAAIPIGLIVNELVSNAFKHAFRGVDNPTIQVRLAKPEQQLELTIVDNGIGTKPVAEAGKDASFGLKLVDMLVQQLDGSMKVIYNNGTFYKIILNAD